MKSIATPHAIGQLRLDLRLESVDADGQRHGKAIQQRITTFCQRELEQVLAPLFDQAAPGKSVIRIRKMELDLGSIAANGLETQLVARLRHALAEQLRRLGLPLPDMPPEAQVPASGGQNGRRPAQQPANERMPEAAPMDAAVQRLSPELCQIEMLSALLQGRADRRTARLGWDTLLHALARWEPARLASLLRLELRNEHARRRLLRGLSSQGRRRLWRQLAAPAGIVRCQAGLLAGFKHSARDSPTFLLQLHDIALLQWLTQPEPADTVLFVRGTLQGLEQVQAKPFVALMREALLGARREGLLRTTLEGLSRHAAHAFTSNSWQDMAAAETMPRTPPIPSFTAQPKFESESELVSVSAAYASESARLRNWLRHGVWQEEEGTPFELWLSSVPDALLLSALREAGLAAVSRLMHTPAPWRQHVMALLAGPMASAMAALQGRLPQAASRLRLDEVMFISQAEQFLLVALLSGQTNSDTLHATLAETLALQSVRDYSDVWTAIAVSPAQSNRAPTPVLLALPGVWRADGMIDGGASLTFAADQQTQRERQAVSLNAQASRPDWTWRRFGSGPLHLARPRALRSGHALANTSLAAERTQLLHWLENGRWLPCVAPYTMNLADPARLLYRHLTQQPAPLLAQLQRIADIPGVLPRLRRHLSPLSLSALVLALHAAAHAAMPATSLPAQAEEVAPIFESVLAQLRNWLCYGIWQAEAGLSFEEWLSSLPDALLLQALREAGPAAAPRLLHAPLALRRHIMALLAKPMAAALAALQARIAQAGACLPVDDVRFARHAEHVLLDQLLRGQTDVDALHAALADALAHQFFRDYSEIHAAIAGGAPASAPAPAPAPALLVMLGKLWDEGMAGGAEMPDFAAAQQALRALRALQAVTPARAASMPAGVAARCGARLARPWWRPPVVGALNVTRPAWLRAVPAPASPAAERAQLLHWLESGQWPWWAADQAAPAPMLRRQLAQAPALLLAQLHEIVEVHGVLPRLLRHLPPSSLSALVLAMQAALGGFILTWIKAGATLVHAPTFSAQQRSSSVDLHWRVALGYLLRAPGAVLTPGGFVADASRLCAQHLSMPTQRYVDALRDAARAGAMRDTRYAVLVDVLESSADRVLNVPLATAVPGPVFGTVQDAEAPAAADVVAIAVPSPAVSTIASAVPSAVATLASTLSLYRYRTPCDIPAAGADSPQSTALSALECLLRYGRALTVVQLRALDAVITQLMTASAARRRRWRKLIRDAAGQALERNRLSTLLPSALLVRLLPLLLPAPIAAEVTSLLAAWTTILPSNDRRRAVCVAWDVLLDNLNRQRAQPWSAARFLLALAERCRTQYGHRPLRLLAGLESALPPHGEAHVLQARRSVASAMQAAVSATLPKKVMPARMATAAPKAEETLLPADQALYLGNAGLVLLWPFLTRYFEMLGLVTEGNFVDDRARSRAVYLLQFLASGSHEAPEHELLLNKLLCGMPAAVSPEFVDAPDEQAINNGLSLLRAVTQRWEKLKNTSVDGLRETFLMREGRLLLHEDKVTLTVSHKAYDMLLDSLPWSYSMIKLPWMQKMLFVQWR